MRNGGVSKIAVIGYKGIVGGATYNLLKRLDHNVVGMDVDDKPEPSDIAFVCIPETAVTYDNLSKYKTGLFVIRSTVRPGACERLERVMGVHVAHNPEFLREATYLTDEFNPDRIIIGECCRAHGDRLVSLYKPLRRPIIRSQRRVTELTKLACNGWLATVISYWNEIDKIAAQLGISGTEVGMLASTDPRISAYGSRFHAKFGGKCLPKDVGHLIDIARGNNITPQLLEAVMQVNDECR